jgi:regulator of nonsense transcripts 2
MCIPCRRLDPPSNYFRIRLVCALLDTCGGYFTKGRARTRMDAFLPYLARYILAKPPMPLDVDFDLQVGVWGGEAGAGVGVWG